MHRPRSRPSQQQQQYHRRLQAAIDDVNNNLHQLLRLGRSGQWVLHHEDIYKARLDTRPHTRNPESEVPIDNFSYAGMFVRGWDMIWAGKGPVPNLRDAAFWEAKHKALEEQIERARTWQVQPRFTPEELQMLELLEQQEDHLFHGTLRYKKCRLENDKTRVLHRLLRLAELGRPGQWILHHEDLYHPSINTRPQTRNAGDGISIRDFMFQGKVVREAAFHGIQIPFELVWAGRGPLPDFTDPAFWGARQYHLFKSIQRVEEGLVQPRFSAGELRALEAMEAQEDHVFFAVARHRREEAQHAMTRPPEAAQLTPEAQRAAQDLSDAQWMVWNELRGLWESGLAGQWLLYQEPLYIPENDARARDHTKDEDPDADAGVDTDGNDPRIIFRGSDGLRYDDRDGGPLPDFSSLAYWQAKRVELRQKRVDALAGKVRHRFAPGDLMRIQLRERALQDEFEQKSAPVNNSDMNTNAKQIEAWLGVNRARKRLPSTPPPVYDDDTNETVALSHDLRTTEPVNEADDSARANDDIFRGTSGKRKRQSESRTQGQSQGQDRGQRVLLDGRGHRHHCSRLVPGFHKQLRR
ncbi:hypothetical protein SPI_02317 [Niveomyces insectorum RCEF 264]|uniref:Uncharacterized protein n=1 Tax=Niveomyces insectorum RCEF 264 TaxID=1081102 RepID=A0A162MR41_9HYPO|nr:hypothetical protein SPI_02317 [Niveomyces insectorum RCEF 264]